MKGNKPLQYSRRHNRPCNHAMQRLFDGSLHFVFLYKKAAKLQIAMDGIKWPGAAREEDNSLLIRKRANVGRQDCGDSSGGEA